VYQYGDLIRQNLEEKTSYNFQSRYYFRYAECTSLISFAIEVLTFKPDMVIVNYHPGSMPWFELNVALDSCLSYGTKCIVAMIYHDIVPDFSGREDVVKVIYQIQDTINQKYYFERPQVKRLAFDKQVAVENGTVGIFGFPLENRGYKAAIDIIKKSLSKGYVYHPRFHIPRNSTMPSLQAEEFIKDLSRYCREQLKTEAEITTDFLDQENLVAWLSSNSVNLAIATEDYSLGISGRPDWMVAAGSPFLVSDSALFRHIIRISESFDASKTELHDAWHKTNHLVNSLRELWTYKNFQRKAIQIFDEMLHI
jgi:hypothetical protein